MIFLCSYWRVAFSLHEALTAPARTIGSPTELQPHPEMLITDGSETNYCYVFHVIVSKWWKRMLLEPHDLWDDAWCVVVPPYMMYATMSSNRSLRRCIRINSSPRVVFQHNQSIQVVSDIQNTLLLHNRSNRKDEVRLYSPHIHPWCQRLGCS